MERAALLVVKVIGVFLIAMTGGLGLIFTMLMLAFKALGGVALEAVRSPFARSGGLIALAFGAAVWLASGAFH